MIKLLVQDTPPNNAYLLPDILRGLGNASAAQDLLRQLHNQQDRASRDFQWARKMVEAILACDSTKLYDLLQFALESNTKHSGTRTRLDWVRSGARRGEIRIDAKSLELFRSQPSDTRLHMLPILLLDRRREVLREALQFFMTYEGPVDWQRSGDSNKPGITLSLTQPIDVVEFLAALPAVEPSAMIVARSALLGPLSGFVWSQRHILREQCLKTLQASVEEENVLENAIRILLFVGEPTLATLCESLIERSDRVGTFAKLVPTLVPTLIDQQKHKRRLLDTNRNINERTGDMAILTLVNANIGQLFSALDESDPDPKRVEILKFIALMQCSINPFKEAIPLLEEHLSKVDSSQAQIFVPMVTKLGSLPVPEALNMLLRALSHPEPSIRISAALTLGTRRSRRALPGLLESCAEEMNEMIAQSMAVSAIASGPRSASDFETLWLTLPNGSHWRCILAGRLRDTSTGEHLVALATDPMSHWQLRRAAILAASRLPYKSALEKIVPIVLQERSSFHIDQNHNLLAHSTIALLTLEEAPGMLQRFVVGKDRFVNLFGDIFEDCWRDNFSRDDKLPSGKAAAGWLFDRLTHHGWPHNQKAPDMVIWELHIPILHAATLRALRLCGKTEVIEEQISRAYHPWFLMKCIKELIVSDKHAHTTVNRINALVAASPWPQNPFVVDMLQNMRNRLHAQESTTEKALGVPQEPPAVMGTLIDYRDIVRALVNESFSFNPMPPFVMKDLAADEHKHLSTLLDPSMDYKYTLPPPAEPTLRFLRGGYTIGTEHPNQLDNQSGLRAALRPAVAAANRFMVAIPWHRELLHNARYVQSFFTCLAAQNDVDRFYDELTWHADLLIPELSDITQTTPILKFIDVRIVPFLERYSGAGTDAFLEVLCALARRIEGPEIDPVLAMLLHRWIQRFDHKAKRTQHTDNHQLWRALGHLSTHPRFTLINDHENRLSFVVKTNIHWFHKNQIIRILEKSPRAYAEIERTLTRTANFEHFFEDEVDRLDDAADRLFYEILDDIQESDSDTSSGSVIVAHSQPGGESRSAQERDEASKTRTTVLDVLEGWDLLKESANLRSYSMRNWRELSCAIGHVYESPPEPTLGSTHLSLFESTAVVEGRLPMTTLAVPLLTYERLWLPDPAFSFFSHAATESWRCLPESGSTYFTGKKSISTSWNTLWTAPADVRKTLLLEHLPKILSALRQLRPLIEDGAIGLVPWESLFSAQRAEFRGITNEVRNAKSLIDVTATFDQAAYSLGARLGAIGIGVNEDQPDLKLKKGDKLHLADKTHMVLMGLLHSRICSAVGASFLPNLQGDRAVYDFLKGSGAPRLLIPQRIVLPNIENAGADEIVAIRRESASLAKVRCLLRDASAVKDASGISGIQARLEEATAWLKEDPSLWRSAKWAALDATVSIVVDTSSDPESRSRTLGIAANTLVRIATLTSSTRSYKDAAQIKLTPASEILVRVTNGS